MIVMWCNNKET